jgi:hypothetical protein
VWAVPELMHVLHMCTYLSMNRSVDHLFGKYLLSKVCFNKGMQFVDNMCYMKLNDFLHQDLTTPPFSGLSSTVFGVQVCY